METFELFVSSPGDVMVERRRVENVVSRLNGEFADVARLEAIRWETEHYQAFSTFQAQIPRSIDCDLVIGILKWRLGTELPPDFGEKLPDGRPFPSGTAYEILTAIEKRQEGGKLPDIYVFRFAGSSPSVAVEDPNRARVEHDWQMLKGFFQEWFLTDRGYFKAAFNSYSSEDDFEAQLEKLLRKWVADKVVGGRVVRWPIEVKGSPFRGLAAFGAKHAPVLFGRSNDTTRAVDLWREAASRGSPYLLVVGASGSGKSSLARAGVIPRLTTPGVIKEVDAWRVAVIRPGDSAAGPFTALAIALMQDEAGLAKEEEGRGPALPEIGRGDSQTPAELAAVLHDADAAAAIKPIVNALVRVAVGEHERERYGRELRCDLVLLIDQFEELFAASVSEAERKRFIDLMAALVGTGHVWIAATLRADFYARMLDQPALRKLKELGTTYDLAAPGPVELAEIVRGPAEAAGLVFETDAVIGERLDERLLRDADRPDMLPLVQLALSRVFEGRESVGGEIRLPLKVYEGLGGLKGIVNEAGETALASLGEAEKARLPRLLRRLAVPTHVQDAIGKGALTIRAVPLAQAAPDAAAGNLLDALVRARLLTTSGVEAEAQVRLAHQKVLEDWARARTIVVESADFYRIRADLEDSRRKWETGQRRGEFLARGLPLAEAESIVGKYGDELTPEVLAYVRASRQRANRAQMIGWGAAAVFFLVAVGAGVAAKVAVDQRAAAEAARAQAVAQTQRADRNFTAAKDTVDGLIFNIAQGLQGVVGMRVDTIHRILETVQKTINQLTQTAPDDPKLLRSRSAMFNNFATTYLAAGDLKDASAAAAQSLDIARKLAGQDQGNAEAQRDLATSLQKLGDVKLQAGDQTGALAAYRESLDIVRTLAAQDPSNAEAQRDLATSLIRLGAVKLQAGDQAGALAAYQDSLDIARKLAAQDPGNAAAQRDVAVTLSVVGDVKLQAGDQAGALAAYQDSLDIARKLAAQDQAYAQTLVSMDQGKLGDVKLRAGDQAGAFAAYQDSLDITRKLAAQDPSNAQAQRGVSVSLNKVGDVKLQAGDQLGALAAYQESLDIARRLAAQDPGNALAQRDLAVSLNKVGDVKLQAGDQAGALAAHQESLDIRRKLAAQDLGNAQAQRDVSVSLNELGNVKLQAGDRAGALAAHQESLDVARRLAAQDPGNAQAQRDVSVSLDRLGDVKLQAGDRAGALAAHQESLDIRRRLAAQDPGNAQAQRDVSVSLDRLGDVKLQAGDRAGALAAHQESLDIRRKLAAQDPGNAQAQRDVSVSLDRLGDVKLQAGDQAGALAAHQESLDIARKLAAQDPGNAQAQRDVAVSLQKLGDVKLQAGDRAGALAADQDSLDIARKLAAQGPGNAQAQRDVAVSLDTLGDVKLQAGDQAGALTAYQESLDIARKLAAQDPSNAQAQRDVAVSLQKLGDVKLQAGDRAGALAAHQESLDIVRKLAAQDPGNAQAQRDVAVTLDNLGDVKLLTGDRAGALAAYQECVDIVRKLAAQDPGNAQAQRDVAVTLDKLGDVKLQAGDRAGALAAYQECVDIVRKLAAQDPGNAQAQTDLVTGLVKTSSVDPGRARAELTEALSILKKLDQEQKLTTAQKDLRDLVRASLSKLR